MRNRMLIWLLLGGGAFVLFLVTVAALVVTVGSGDGKFAFGDRIQVVNIDGELTDSRFLIGQLKRYEDAESVRGILLNINSPGGGLQLLRNCMPRFGACGKKKARSLLPISRRSELPVRTTLHAGPTRFLPVREQLSAALV